MNFKLLLKSLTFGLLLSQVQSSPIKSDCNELASIVTLNEADECIENSKGEVTYLYLRDKGLSDDQLATVFSYDTITSLNVYWSGSQTVIDKIEGLKNLETLSLFNTVGGSTLYELENLKKLKKLTSLAVKAPFSRNIRLAKNSFRYLSNLKELYLKEFIFSQDIISDLSKLTKLKSLTLENCGFPEGLNYYNIRKLGKLSTLHVTSFNKYSRPLYEIPSSFYRLTNLKELTLARQKLSKLSSNISNLAKLEILNMSSNNITTLPSALNKLPNLKYVDFRSNPLEGKTLTNKNLKECYYDATSTTLCKAKQMSCFVEEDQLKLC